MRNNYDILMEHLQAVLDNALQEEQNAMHARDAGLRNAIAVEVSLSGLPGTFLPNGAYVIAQKFPNRTHPEDSIVLCLWGRRDRPEYVTWVCNSKGCEWGHYFDGIMAAVEDYRGRGV